MPLIEITMAEGRTPETIRSMITTMTDALEQSIGARRESIQVIVREVSTDHWAAGGETLTEIRARQAAGATQPRP